MNTFRFSLVVAAISILTLAGAGTSTAATIEIPYEPGDLCTLNGKTYNPNGPTVCKDGWLAKCIGKAYSPQTGGWISSKYMTCEPLAKPSHRNKNN
jgi:hypothetical protein